MRRGWDDRRQWKMKRVKGSSNGREDTYLGRWFGVAGGDDGPAGHALGVVLRFTRHGEERRGEVR
jgi:hypothetical protein